MHTDRPSKNHQNWNDNNYAVVFDGKDKSNQVMMSNAYAYANMKMDVKNKARNV